jgi:tetratricopeptide (TPR) repeat protein
MDHATGFKAKFNFFDSRLLLAAKDLISENPGETFFGQDALKINDLELSFEMNTSGPLPVYDNTAHLISLMADYATSGFYETHFDGNPDDYRLVQNTPAQCYAALGTNYADSGDHRAALHCFEKALEFNGADSRIYFACGLAHEKLRNYDEAVENFLRVDHRDALHYADAIEHAVQIKTKLLQYRQAISLLNDAIEKGGNTAKFYYLRGKIKFNAEPGVSKEAIADWQNAIAKGFPVDLKKEAVWIGQEAYEQLQSFTKILEQKRREAKEMERRVASAIRQEKSEPRSKRKVHVGPMHILGLIISVIGLLAAVAKALMPVEKPGGISSTRYNTDSVERRYLSDSLIAAMNKANAIPAFMMHDEAFTVYKNENLHALYPNIGAMKNLKLLLVMSNPLDSLPSSIGNLVKLEKIDVTRCSLRTIPGSLRNLVNLHELDISNNPIDSIPDIFDRMPMLQRLSAGTYGGCYSSTPRRTLVAFPLSIGSLANLLELDLSGFNLRSLPDTLRNLHSLKILQLSGNRLDSLPSWISELQNLEAIYVSDNLLYDLPASMRSMPKLKFICLSGNMITSATARIPYGCSVTYR